MLDSIRFKIDLKSNLKKTVLNLFIILKKSKYSKLYL